MEWFTKTASQSVNNLKFNHFILEEMVSVNNLHSLVLVFIT